MSYDPTIGRWIAEDPIVFEGGDTDLYRYMGNSPTNGTDPYGLTAFMPQKDAKPTVVPIVLGDPDNPNDEKILWDRFLTDRYYQRLRNDPDFKKLYNCAKSQKLELRFTTAVDPRNAAEYIPGENLILIYVGTNGIDALDKTELSRALIHEMIHAILDKQGPMANCGLPAGANDSRHDQVIIQDGPLQPGIVMTDDPAMNDPEFKKYMDKYYYLYPNGREYIDQNKITTDWIEKILKRIARRVR
jgi:hypothetical protein